MAPNDRDRSVPGLLGALLSVAVLGSTAACKTVPGSLAPATPQRPTVSSATTTTAHRTFELEAGAVIDPGDRLDTPTTLKYGAGPRTEVFAGWSPLLDVDEGGVDETGVGDALVGVRHRFADETATTPSGAVQATVKLPVADEEDGLGSGEVDASFALIATRSAGDFSLNGFYELDVIGDPGGNADIGHDVTLAGSAPVAGDWGVFGELVGSFVPERDQGAVFTIVGVTLSPHPAVVFDVAAVVGLNEDAPDFQLLFGLTRNLGQPRLGHGGGAVEAP